MSSISTDSRIKNSNWREWEYRFYVSSDGINYSEVVHQGIWNANHAEKSVEFTPINAQYMKLEVTEGVNGMYSIAELNVGIINRIIITPITTPPVTTAVISQPQPDGQNGWYVNPVSISVSAVSEESVVDKTEYRVNNGLWETYTGSIPAYDNGTYTFDYRSVDTLGNVEPFKTIMFKIDQIVPDLTVQLDKMVIWPANHKMVSIQAMLNSSDALSGIESVILTSITSNEPDGQNDIIANIGSADTTFSLRAERLKNDQLCA